MSQSSIQTKVFSLLCVLAVGCQGKSDDDKKTVEPTPPHTCLTMSLVGEFPENGKEASQTWVYGCFEGYEIWNGQKLFIADSACKNGQTLSSNPDFPFSKLESVSCPEAGTTFTCVGDTWSIRGYKQPNDLFSMEKFAAYCKSKSGVIRE